MDGKGKAVVLVTGLTLGAGQGTIILEYSGKLVDAKKHGMEAIQFNKPDDHNENNNNRSPMGTLTYEITMNTSSSSGQVIRII